MVGAVVLLAALGVAAPAGASDAPEAAVTFQAGLTHTQQSVDGDPESRASAEALLETVGPLQNQHLMGWGAENPEPEPGVYDWSSLDERIALIERTGGVPVITLCSAPGWMKGADDWDMDAAPAPEHYDDFADLAVETARRYPQVRYFQVWNELKGFWDEERNRWDHEGYTELYNLVYTRLKEHDPDLIVGGPYVSLNVYADPEGMSHPSDLSGDWGTVDQRDLDAIQYWLEHNAGADFLAVDGWSRTRDGHHPPAERAGDMFRAVSEWLVDRSELPVWWSEFYAPLAPDGYESSPAAIRSVLEGMRDGGASVALWWGPECDGSGFPCVWTSTRETGGGRPTDYLPVLQEFAAG
ncbi:xylan 1,4-beta-xylosidase [Streptomyces sp. 8K308]|uniref:xylan 1,4-beta-xylosidase n=1 Tax=Streptomyces sp. 8K308 TaxID=2530388 RepID=UPI00104BC52B|nr:xylan 1,4-beta-xylosidase [Streptomyces sp. 8K308]TDC25969.1 xylan 1,4-beta-xylosidase [Streptomyces sp. 8K308]